MNRMGLGRIGVTLASTAVVALTGLVIPTVAATTADPVGQVTEFAGGTRDESSPYFITAGPDGNMWYTEQNWVLVGKVTPSGTLTEYSLTNGIPSGIAAGPDGNLWVTTQEGPAISKITPGGQITSYRVGLSDSSGPFGIAAGRDGNMWFADPWADQVGKISPTGAIAVYATTPTTDDGPRGITAGPDGNMWFAEGAGRVGKVTPDGVVTEYPAGPSSGGPYSIAAGPDGNLWFTEYGARVGKITTDGVVTEYTAGITAGVHPRVIAAGPDGNMWFTETGGRVGKLSTTGVITEFAAGITGTNLEGIAAGPEGNMWFTEGYSNTLPRGLIAKIGTGQTAPPADANGDGIADILQPSPTPTDSFVKGWITPSTYGSIVARNGLAVSITAAADPDGVLITVGNGPVGTQARLSLCGFAVLLDTNTQTTATCGSVTLKVTQGEASVVLGGGISVVSIPSGGQAKITDTGSGSFSVANLGSAGSPSVSLTVDGTTTLLPVGSTTAAQTWHFVGFSQPVDNLPVLNSVKAGRAIPVKWRLLDSTGSPITTLSSASISTTTAACATSAAVDAVEETLASGSGLLNLGNGFYQVDWKTPTTYANSCRTMRLDLHDGVTHDALFHFTK